MVIRGFVYSLIMWIVLGLLAFANGSLREFGIKKFVAEPWAHHISVVTGIIIIFLATLIFFNIFKSLFSLKDAIIIGLCWIILTVAFEFLFGHYVTGHTWEELVQQYDILSGNLWLVALIAIGVSPWAAMRLIK